MIHVRTIFPAALTDQVIARLDGEPGVQNIVVLPAAGHAPRGDAIECDIATASANAVLRDLRQLELEHSGSVVLEPVDLVIARDGPGDPGPRRAVSLAPVWLEVEGRIRAAAVYPPSFFFLLIVAGLIGACGILTNSQILIVAAMVVGPEYWAITSVALGLDVHDRVAIGRGLRALGVGFLLAIVGSFLFSLCVRGLGAQSRAYELGIRPVANLINSPDFFSVVVAVLAGMVGIVALTSARSSLLLGVFISVTTIPAASDMGVSLAFHSWNEAEGSFLQLLLNIGLLIVVGFGTLRFQRWFWGGVNRRTRAVAQE
jgi:uncharacterized hydrophobic protein (TIGR00271 family)